MTRRLAAPLLAVALALAATASASASASASAQEPGTFPGLPEPLPPPDLDDPGTAQATPAELFFAHVSALCGQAFVGTIRVDTPTPREPMFGGSLPTMHVRECTDDTVRIALHGGEDRSRTWVLTRTGTGLRLKHDHRHEDGSPDAVTMYGGDTTTPGTATRQAFPADAASVALFTREGLAASTTNVWALEIDPGKTFVYELTRPGGRRFELAFDLTMPVLAPPPPWGADP
jgi:hypothetical protein